MRGYGDGLYGECYYGGADVLASYAAGFIRFPVTAVNYALVPRTFVADPNLDWRCDIIRPSTPINNGDFHAATSNPFWLFFYNFAGTEYLYGQMFFADHSVVQAAIAPPVGFPAVGERVQLRCKWDSVANVLTLYWRTGTPDLLDDVTPWTLGVAAAPIANVGPIETFWYLSDPTAVSSLASDLYRAVLIQNGVVHIDVNGAVNLDGVAPTAPSFVASTGQTVSIIRAGSPQVVLVATVYESCSVIHVVAPCPEQQIGASGPVDRLADLVPCIEGDC